eukprot:TRINITY_DN379_c0_g1_i3.p1 TRINITY_DN379_c0_g1~~TRINITY_DN379_c0_g1_i3.p1  ORF type:complete len:784 (-),score=276.09 TRINITY_DN379_c0_g1_i3:533-2884(-)
MAMNCGLCNQVIESSPISASCQKHHRFYLHKQCLSNLGEQSCPIFQCVCHDCEALATISQESSDLCADMDFEGHKRHQEDNASPLFRVPRTVDEGENCCGHANNAGSNESNQTEFQLCNKCNSAPAVCVIKPCEHVYCEQCASSLSFSAYCELCSHVIWGLDKLDCAEPDYAKLYRKTQKEVNRYKGIIHELKRQSTGLAINLKKERKHRMDVEDKLAEVIRSLSRLMRSTMVPVGGVNRNVRRNRSMPRNNRNPQGMKPPMAPQTQQQQHHQQQHQQPPQSKQQQRPSSNNSSYPQQPSFRHPQEMSPPPSYNPQNQLHSDIHQQQGPYVHPMMYRHDSNATIQASSAQHHHHPINPSNNNPGPVDFDFNFPNLDQPSFLPAKTTNNPNDQLPTSKQSQMPVTKFSESPASSNWTGEFLASLGKNGLPLKPEQQTSKNQQQFRGGDELFGANPFGGAMTHDSQQMQQQHYQQQQQQPKQSILGQPPYASQMYNQLYSHPYNAVQPQYQQQQQHAHDVASFVSPIEQPSWKVDAPDFAPSLSANASEYTPSFAISSPVTAVDIDVGNAGVDTGAVVAPSLNIGVISDGKCDASAINEKVDTISDSTIAAIEMIADDDDEKEKEEEKQKKNDLKEDIVTEDNEKSDSTEPNQQQHQSEDGSETIQVPEGIEQFICENALMMMQDEDGSFVVVVEEMDDDIASIRVLESNDQLDIMSEDLVAILPSPGDTVQVRELSSRGVVTSVERHAIEGYVMGVSFIDDNLPKSEKFGKFPCYDIVKLFLAV